MATIVFTAVLAAVAMAIVFGARALSDASRSPMRHQPAPAVTVAQIAGPRRHWARTTAVVETALTRSLDMKAFHEHAARQLDAADYALHTLLAEISQVMNTAVASPLAMRPQPGAVVAPQTAALAA